MCSDERIAEGLDRALARLLSQDAHMLPRKTSERAVTGRLAMYLQAEFPDHEVDVEYNRHGEKPKRAKRALIVPDIVVHKRGNDHRNVLALEVKPFW